MDQKPDQLSQDSRALSGPPVDFRVRLKCPPSEPEVIAVSDRCQRSASHWTFNRLAQYIPGAARFIVYEGIALGAESQLGSVQRSLKHAGCSDFIGFANQEAIQCGLGSGFEEHDDVSAAHRVIHRTLFVKGRKREGYGGIADGEGGHSLLGLQPTVQGLDAGVKEEGWLVHTVVPNVGVLTVGPIESGIPGKDQAFRMRFGKVGEGDYGSGHESKFSASKLPHNALARQLLPPTLSLPVPHNQVAQTQVTRYPKVVDNPVNGLLECSGRVFGAQGMIALRMTCAPDNRLVTYNKKRASLRANAHLSFGGDRGGANLTG